MSDFQVTVGGYWVSAWGHVGGLEWETVADGGCDTASWSMQLGNRFAHPAVKRGARVVITVAGLSIWSGLLSEPDPDEWQFEARGLYTRGNDFLAFDSTLSSSSNPDVAVDEAIARGLEWTRPASILNNNVGAATPDRLNTVNELLDAYCQTAGKRWLVNAAGEVVTYAEPTAPVWHLNPDQGTFGLADDEYSTHLYLRYMNTSGALATATASDAGQAARYGKVERAIDGTTLGPVASITAQAAADGEVTKGAARLAWTRALTIRPGQLTTANGSPAPLWAVKGGDMLRLHGVQETQGLPMPYTDIVIGEAAYSTVTGQLGVTPVRLAARTYADQLGEVA